MFDVIKHYWMPACKWTVLLCASCTVGCGNNQMVRQLQNENDRLLAEYRAEREQKQQLSEKLAATQARLAESEKLVARQNPLPASRISRVEPVGPLPYSSGGVSSPSGTNAGQPLSSGASGVNRTATTASPTPDLQWRPMNKTPR